jgi:hypothetical protein
MKKTGILFIIVLLVAVITPLVFAIGSETTQQGTNVNSETGIEEQVNTELQTQNQGEETQLQNQVQVQTGTYTNQFGEQMQVQLGEGNEVKLQSGNVEAKTTMVMTQENVQNKTQLKVQLSNGLNSEVKVMPNTASETALAKLGAKCEGECTIELKEVGTGNQVKAAYEIKTQKQAKVLGLFQAKMQVQAQVDAETGEVIQAKKPWWAFLATE